MSRSMAGVFSTRKSGVRPCPACISAGGTRAIHVAAPLALSNKGGVITLVDERGLKVHGVSYTKEQARNPGWTLTF